MAREVAADAGLEDRVTFVEADLFTTAVDSATIVTLFLSESLNAKLWPKLKRELRPGTRIVSRRYGFAGWPPDRAIRASDGSELLLWTVR